MNIFTNLWNILTGENRREEQRIRNEEDKRRMIEAEAQFVSETLAWWDTLSPAEQGEYLYQCSKELYARDERAEEEAEAAAAACREQRELEALEARAKAAERQANAVEQANRNAEYRHNQNMRALSKISKGKSF